jgi:hypothetical protein
MPLDPTHVRFKLLHACDQWHSSRESAVLTVAIVNHVEILKAELGNVTAAGLPETFLAVSLGGSTAGTGPSSDVRNVGGGTGANSDVRNVGGGASSLSAGPDGPTTAAESMVKTEHRPRAGGRAETAAPIVLSTDAGVTAAAAIAKTAAYRAKEAA